MEKLSDVFGYALTRIYKPANPGFLSGTGMCCALTRMYRLKLVPYQLATEAQVFIVDLLIEMETYMQVEDVVFAYLYEPLETFKGYDVNDLQYLVWQAIIDKLRSEGR